MQPNGDWLISAQSPSYSAIAITITVRTTLEYVDPSVHTLDNFNVNIVCAEPTLGSFFNPTYSYTVGDAALVILKPPVGSVTADSCNSDCVISLLDSGSSSDWFTE